MRVCFPNVFFFFSQLQLRQARETGICPVREELYAQCFDELIRQVTINCAERGLLLLRVRDELRMTIAAYQTLYESSIAFGMRKALQAEQGKADMEARIKQLELQLGVFDSDDWNVLGDDSLGRCTIVVGWDALDGGGERAYPLKGGGDGATITLSWKRTPARGGGG